jgi:hypothetical protein
MAVYAQQGHNQFPEDSWSDTAIIENEKDLYRAAIGWYKRSASSFNNYPFNGMFTFSAIYYIQREYVEDTASGERFYSESTVECPPPPYATSAATMFKDYIAYISRRLRDLQEARRRAALEAYEKNEYERLKTKFKEK